MVYSRHARVAVRKARVEIIPLLDCMFLLLCFFIYVTMSMVVQRGIFVNLARAETGEVTEEEKETFDISIDAGGRLYRDKNPVSKDQLKAQLEQFRRAEKGGAVVIHADKGTTHERVMGVLDFVRQSGIAEVVFAVEPSQTIDHRP